MASFNTTGANRIPRVLFFVTGNVPTEEQIEDIGRFGPNASFRNALAVAQVAMSPLEECDAVAGEVPERYAAVYPNVNDLDTGGRLLRMSDLDRAHGPVHSVDNEAARAAKPPSFGGDRVMAQGASRPSGAMTAANGGFVAPIPGNPDNIQTHGSERAENGPEGANREGRQGSNFNPDKLPDAGVILPRSGDTGAADGLSSGTVAEGGGQGGFTAPKPAEPEAASPKKGKGATGDTGATA